MDWHRFKSLYRQLVKVCMAYKYDHTLLVLIFKSLLGRKFGNTYQLKLFN